MRRALSLTACLAVAAVLLPAPAQALRGRPAQFDSTSPYSYFVADVGNRIEAAIAASPAGPVYTAAEAGEFVYRTSDGGLTWTAAPTSPQLLLNEGDVAVSPDGQTVVSVWVDLAHLQTSRVWVSHDAGATFTETHLVGPQPVPDRPWVLVNGDGRGGLVGWLDAASTPHVAWGSADGGTTWIQQTLTNLTSTSDPELVADPYMDYAGPAYSEGSLVTPLPGGGFLDTTTGRWTRDFATWFAAAGPIRQLANTASFKIGSTGAAYQSQFAAGGRKIQYRYLKAGVWSPWREVATFAQAGRYKHNLLQDVIEPMMALGTHGRTLGINARDGDQDVLIRIANADSSTPAITREKIGRGCTARYDFPTLVFDAQGRAVTSFCEGSVAGLVAYQL